MTVNKINQLKIDMSVCEYSLLTRINLTKCCNQDKIIRKFVTRIVIRIRIMRFDQDLMKSKCRKLGGGGTLLLSKYCLGLFRMLIKT